MSGARSWLRHSVRLAPRRRGRVERGVVTEPQFPDVITAPEVLYVGITDNVKTRMKQHAKAQP